MSSILTGRKPIADYLGVCVNSLHALIEAGMPVRVVGTMYIADKRAIRQWLGVRLPLTRAEINRIIDERMGRG
jgi:hypothetical protein